MYCLSAPNPSFIACLGEWNICLSLARGHRAKVRFASRGRWRDTAGGRDGFSGSGVHCSLLAPAMLGYHAGPPVELTHLQWFSAAPHLCRSLCDEIQKCPSRLSSGRCSCASAGSVQVILAGSLCEFSGIFPSPNSSFSMCPAVTPASFVSVNSLARLQGWVHDCGVSVSLLDPDL